jgi:hypothetical protein
MPVVNAAFLAGLRANQGIGNVWRAGHHFGSFPTMEVASYWGKVAAFQALAKTTGNGRPLQEFEDRMRSQGRSIVRNFKMKVAALNFAVCVAVVFGYLLLALVLVGLVVRFAGSKK